MNGLWSLIPYCQVQHPKQRARAEDPKACKAGMGEIRIRQTGIGEEEKRRQRDKRMSEILPTQELSS